MSKTVTKRVNPRTVTIGGKLFGVPDVKEKKSRPVGATSGKTLYQFLVSLFEANASYKMTDAQIEELVRREFQGSAVVNSIDTCPESNSLATRVAVWRSTYNRGIMTGRKVPKLISYRYDAAGNIVDNQTATRALSSEETRAIEQRYRGKDAAAHTN